MSALYVCRTFLRAGALSRRFLSGTSAASAGSTAAAAGPRIRQLTQTEFERLMSSLAPESERAPKDPLEAAEAASKPLRNAKYHMVDFFAPWCAPCRALEPVLERLAADVAARPPRNGTLELYKLNGDACDSRMLEKYDLMSYPTVVLFRNGIERGRFVGAKSIEQITAFLRNEASDLELQ